MNDTITGNEATENKKTPDYEVSESTEIHEDDIELFGITDSKLRTLIRSVLVKHETIWEGFL